MESEERKNHSEKDPTNESRAYELTKEEHMIILKMLFHELTELDNQIETSFKIKNTSLPQ